YCRWMSSSCQCVSRRIACRSRTASSCCRTTCCVAAPIRAGNCRRWAPSAWRCSSRQSSWCGGIFAPLFDVATVSEEPLQRLGGDAMAVCREVGIGAQVQLRPIRHRAKQRQQVQHRQSSLLRLRSKVVLWAIPVHLVVSESKVRDRPSSHLVVELAHVRDRQNYERRTNARGRIAALIEVASKQRPGHVQPVRARDVSKDRPLEARQVEPLLFNCERGRARRSRDARVDWHTEQSSKQE